MFLCVPAGAVGSTLSGNATSLVSLVSFSSVVVTLGGKPTRRMTASPANGLVTAGLTNIWVSLPCSTAPRSMLRDKYGGAISREAGWLAPQPGPLAMPAFPIPAYFPFRTGAPPFALSGNRTSFCPSGMMTDDAEPTPGGLYRGTTVIGALNPAARSATTFRFIDPPWTRGTFGSTIVSLNGTASVTTNSVSCSVREV